MFDSRPAPTDSRALMENSDESDYEPEDIFEEIDPTEPPSLDARIRAGDEVDPDELEDEDWDSQLNYLEHLEAKKPKPPKPPEQP
jgi:hypothetical protein